MAAMQAPQNWPDIFSHTVVEHSFQQSITSSTDRFRDIEEKRDHLEESRVMFAPVALCLKDIFEFMKLLRTLTNGSTLVHVNPPFSLANDVDPLEIWTMDILSNMVNMQIWTQ